jgi:hypothetical protein
MSLKKTTIFTVPAKLPAHCARNIFSNKFDINGVKIYLYSFVWRNHFWQAAIPRLNLSGKDKSPDGRRRPAKMQNG